MHAPRDDGLPHRRLDTKNKPFRPDSNDPHIGVHLRADSSGREMIDADSFDDEQLLLPLVSMQVIASAKRALRRRAA